MADAVQHRFAEFIEPFRVEPGSNVKPGRDLNPAFKARVKKKRKGRKLLAEGVKILAEYQARLVAQDTWAVLLVLQALDAAGKDGTIRHVMSGVNPQGVSVRSFKVPSAEELDHDFLWRYARRLPERGEIGIFNRSYYEEVLVVRVRRYREINDWERYLTDNGFRIVKLFLNVSNPRGDAHGASGDHVARRVGPRTAGRPGEGPAGWIRLSSE